MTRVAFASDLHIDPFGGSTRRQRLDDYLRTTRWLAATAKDRGCEALIVAGDFTENSAPERRVPRIRRALQVGPGRQVYLRGNHDQQEQSDEGIDSIVTLLDDGGQRTGVARPSLEAISADAVLACIPFVDRRWLRSQDEYSKVPEADVNRVLGEQYLSIARGLYAEARRSHPAAAVVLVGHQTLATGWMSDQQQAFLGDRDLVVDTSALAAIGFEAIVFGHLHKHQVIPMSIPVIYPGSIERVDWAEADQPKGFVLADVARGRFDWEFVEVPARRFVTLTGEQIADDIAEEQVEGAVVRVRDLEPEYDAAHVREMLINLGAFEVSTITYRSAPRDAPAGSLSESLSPYEALAEHFASHPDGDALIELGRQLLLDAGASRGVPEGTERRGAGLRPLSLELCNFMNHRDLVIPYADGRLWVFAGLNGSGKSAAASDALQFCLFGTARLAIDELVRWGQTDMSVSLTFEQGPRIYRVVRGRSLRSGGKSFLNFDIRNTDGSWGPVLASGGIPETEVAVEAVLGMDAKTFRASVLLGQRDLLRFAAGKPAERADVLSKILDLVDFKAAADAAAAEERALKKALEVEQARLDRLAEQMADEGRLVDDEAHWASELERLRELEDASVSAREQAEARLRELAADIATVAAARRELTQLVVDMRQTEDDGKAAAAGIAAARQLLKERPAIESAVAAMPALQGRVDALEERRRQLSRAQRDLAAAQNELRSAEQTYAAAVAEFERRMARAKAMVEELEGLAADGDLSTCMKCGKRNACGHVADLARRLEVARQAFREVGDPPKRPLSIDRARAAVSRAESHVRESDVDEAELSRLRAELDETKSTAARAGAVATAAEDLERCTADRNRLMVAWKDAEARKASASALVAGSTELLKSQTSQQEIVSAASEAIAAIQEQRRQAITHHASAMAALEQLQKVVAEADQLTADMTKRRRSIALHKAISGAFGAKGIPSRVFASVLPELASYANELLEKLRPGFAVALRTERAAKSRDGSITALDLVVSQDGLEHSFEGYSGGQQMSVSLAFAVALSRLSARRAGMAVQALFVDEPDGLDLPRRRAFGQAIRQLTYEGGLSLVALVSHHDDLIEYGDHVLRFTEHPDGSVVEALAA